VYEVEDCSRGHLPASEELHLVTQSGIAVPLEAVTRSFANLEYGFQISSDDESKDTKW
jgi:hypothetical protein